MHSKEKIKKISERALLREYISLYLSKKLLEQDDGYYGDYVDTGLMVGGSSEPGAPSSDVVSFLTKSDFARLLGLDAIHNAFRTAGLAIKGIATKTIGETKILAKSLFWYLMPTFLRSSKFDNIIDIANQERNKIENDLEKIDREYADVIEKNNEIFQNPDLNFAFFVAAPGVVIGKEIVNKSIGVSMELFDLLVGSDRTKENISTQLTGFFNDLTTKIGLNPQDPGHRRAVEENVFSTLKSEFPNLTENELRNIIHDVTSQRLEEQNIDDVQQNVQAKINAFLTTPEGQAYIKAIGTSIQKLKNYISSPLAQQKMNNSSIAKASQQMLVGKIVEAARSAIERYDIDYIKNNYRNEIETYFKEKGIDDSKQIDEMMSKPEVGKEIQKLFKDTLKKAYLQQLNTFEKINPSVLKFAVMSGKKQIEAM